MATPNPFRMFDMNDSNECQSLANVILFALKTGAPLILFIFLLAMTREGMRYLGNRFGIALSHRLVLMVTAMSFMSVAFFFFFRFYLGLGTARHKNEVNDETHVVD